MVNIVIRNAITEIRRLNYYRQDINYVNRLPLEQCYIVNKNKSSRKRSKCNLNKLP